jgi:Metal binding domain of Ada
MPGGIGKYAPLDATLERLEREARESWHGLWSQTGAIAPWEWRHPKPAAPAADAEATVIANRRTFIYHRPGCPNAARISPRNRVTFGSPAAAETAGYRPGNDCH